MFKRVITSLVFLLLALPVPARDRGAARAAYQEALEYHQRLNRIDRSDRSLKQYNRAVFLYRKVLDQDPTYGACDDALYAMATLHDEMWQRFEKERDLSRATYYYRLLAREYPLTRHKAAALERAEELNRPRIVEDRSSQADLSDLATVSEIRYWSSEDYTRVVIQLDREVEFEKQVLSNPDRIYFDLQRAHLRSDLRDRIYDVNDLFIKQIRVGQNRPDVTRVVLDFDLIHKHTVFALYDPFRIVIDTGGEKRPRGSLADTGRQEPIKTAEAVIPLDEEAHRRPEVAALEPAMPAPNLSGDWSLSRTLGLKVGRVVLDPGHGGHDTGTIGASGVREKDLVLDVSLRLKEFLEERLGTDVIMTRSSDRFVPLEERTAIANQHSADLFVSIHANASRNRSVSGIETFFLNFASSADEREVATRENSTSQKNLRELDDLVRQIAMRDYNQESRDLAHVVQNKLYSEIKQYRPASRNRGVKTAPFIVLIGSNMPSILIEIGFISNPSDEKYLKTDQGRQTVAESLYQGIEAYFRSLGAIPVYQRTATGK
ncbi:MAG: N-acetylmuramoyl-L-alanine amidase [Acidobacteriota bacterium]